MHVIISRAQKIKVFAREYLMIVVSIMTALALENAAESLYHRSLAQQASKQIDAEIAANISEIATTIAHNRTEGNKLVAIRTALLADIVGGASDEVLRERLKDQYKGAYRISIRFPSLRREAWEVAVANQAVSHMSSRELKRYSVVYANMRDVQSIQYNGNGNFLDGPGLGNAHSDAQMGIADPRATYRVINQIISSYSQTNGNLVQLEKELRAAAAAAPKT